jgi:radical SAM-linked protein
MARSKVRIRFRKDGNLRLVSHHDLMRTFERMLRRAALPFHSTQGFNPKPRLVFALSLGLGIVGCEEVVQLELDDDLPADEVRDRLAGQAPPGLHILSAETLGPQSSPQVRRVCYRVGLPPDRLSGLSERVAVLLAGSECIVARTRPQPRRIDLRPYLRDVRLERGALEMDLWVTPTGTARPDEVLHLLGLGDLLPAGAVLERTTLEMLDENPTADPRPPTSAFSTAEAAVGPRVPAQPSPLIPGPLSFDS